MNIRELLKSRRSEILAAWQQAIIDTYPMDSGKFLIGVKNQFANPIGNSLEKSLPAILDAIIDSNRSKDLDIAVENLIKIRAIQKFTPTEAVGFMNFLKLIIQKVIKENIVLEKQFESYLEIEEDYLYVLNMTFESYLEMQSRLNDIKLNEVKKTNQKMMERLSRKYDLFENNEDNK